MRRITLDDYHAYSEREDEKVFHHQKQLIGKLQELVPTVCWYERERLTPLITQ